MIDLTLSLFAIIFTSDVTTHDFSSSLHVSTSKTKHKSAPLNTTATTFLVAGGVRIAVSLRHLR